MNFIITRRLFVCLRTWIGLILIGALSGIGCASSTTKEKAAAQIQAAAPVTKESGNITPQSPAASATARMECSLKGDVRVLELREKGKGCEFAYTKNGKESVVASSGTGSAYCEKAKEKLRDKLKASGYTCN
jgi:hypothetical protein